MPELNYYEVLGVRSTASVDDVKRAYREQIRLYHPDSITGQMAKAKQAGDLRVMRALEKRLEESKRKTQQINTAYEVLSDATKRQTYDLKRAGVPQQRSAAYSRDADPYRAGPYATRTNQTPPKASPPPPPPRPTVVDERLPLVWFMALGIGLLIIFSALFVFLAGPALSPSIPVVNDGRLSAQDLQATTIVEEATRSTIMRSSNLPTSTPRTIAEEVAAGDAFFQVDAYMLAIEQYTNAVERGLSTADVFYKRGLAYTQMGTDNALNSALFDFSQSILLDNAYSASYLERALLQYTLWQASGDSALVPAIQADAQRYFDLTGDTQNERLTTILNNLSN